MFCIHQAEEMLFPSTMCNAGKSIKNKERDRLLADLDAMDDPNAKEELRTQYLFEKAYGLG